MSKYLLFVLLGFSAAECMQKTEEIKVRTKPARWVTTTRGSSKKARKQALDPFVNVTVRRAKKPVAATVNAQVAPAADMPVIVEQKKEINSAIAAVAMDERPFVVPSSEISRVLQIKKSLSPQKKHKPTPVKMPKSDLPSHLADAFVSAIKNEHYDMALYLAPRLHKYGPALILRLMIKNPDFVERLAEKYHLPHCINKVNLRKAASYAIELRQKHNNDGTGQ